MKKFEFFDESYVDYADHDAWWDESYDDYDDYDGYDGYDDWYDEDYADHDAWRDEEY